MIDLTNAKPIIFSTPMVRAILDGRKTMTRQVIKFPERTTGRLPESGAMDYIYYPGGIKRPSCKPGDILYVRETWCPCATIDSWIDDINLYAYKADYEGQKVAWKWRSPVTMPKEAARLFLRVTDVRVERLQDISYDDCLGEGIWNKGTDVDTLWAFQNLWARINTKPGYGWNANPWVEVTKFERVKTDA